MRRNAVAETAFPPLFIIGGVVFARMAEHFGALAVSAAFLACAGMVVVDEARRVWRGKWA